MTDPHACIKPSDSETITQAAEMLRHGGLVAFPTETVYGLGADAFNAEAVAQIYRVKGRPSDNPLILHVGGLDEAEALAAFITPYARKLAETFWPGPLTLIFTKHATLPGWVGGHPDGHAATVAVRVPSHPVARALIACTGRPIAAPSANKAGKPSPTCALHVAEDLRDEVALIIDGGAADGGLESTVVDVTGTIPVVLRPGAVTIEMLRAVVGEVTDVFSVTSNPAQPRSPGMKYRHYAPNAPMTLVTGAPSKIADYITDVVLTNIMERENTATKPSYRIGILATTQTADDYRMRFGDCKDIVLRVAGDRCEPSTIARALYGCLRDFDAAEVDIIYAEGIAEQGLGKAVMNRMRKAAQSVVRAETLTVLFVCTGNTCRSPMAAALAGMIYKKAGINAVVHSAGLDGYGTQPASKHAVSVMRDEGLDLTKHCSRAVAKDMADEAALILTMTRTHRTALIARFPEHVDKIYTLGAFAGEDTEVPDPFGQNRAAYRACADTIKELLCAGLQRIKEMENK